MDGIDQDVSCQFESYSLVALRSKYSMYSMKNLDVEMFTSSCILFVKNSRRTPGSTVRIQDETVSSYTESLRLQPPDPQLLKYYHQCHIYVRKLMALAMEDDTEARGENQSCTISSAVFRYPSTSNRSFNIPHRMSRIYIHIFI